jgi:hypothetical protein
MPFARKQKTFFSRDFLEKFSLVPKKHPKMFIIKRKRKSLLFFFWWKAKKMVNYMAKFLIIIIILCVSCAAFRRKNIHHQQGLEKAYSKLNLIKHSALSKQMTENHSRGKAKVIFDVCRGLGGEGGRK